MRAVTATIGWTVSDMENGYSSYDGWKPGAQQHTETVTFEVPETYDDERVCWTLLSATNAPITSNPAEQQALEAIQQTGYRGEQSHWSLSKGDTVTIDGVRYAFTGYAVEAVAA